MIPEENVIDFFRGPGGPTPIRTSGHDWSGSPERTSALAVGCRYCGAAPDQPCRRLKDKQPLGAFPAHTIRISDAREASQ